MFDGFKKLIDAEIAKANAGQEALIRIKINNLEEPDMIRLLYDAGKAGVKVQLIVRSICCLKTGVSGLSDNIIVKRLVDRYLEHTRIFIFGKGDDAEVLIGSADWMNRNLHSRIEVCTSINNTHLKKELVDYFDIQWSDTDKMVELAEDYTQHKIENKTETTINAQNAIYLYLQQLPQ